MFSIAFAAATLIAPPAVPRYEVRPMAEPKPALRYQLLPEVREMNSGNPVQWYLRCFAEQRNFFFGKPGVEERAKYRAMTLVELSKQPLETYGGSAITQADWAARLDAPDWTVLDRMRTEGSEFRMPELEPFRVLAISMQVRFRGEVARKDYTGAIRTAKTMFAFARHLGENPTLAANRLGFEVASMALDTLDEMIRQPHAPNLYWALTDLPMPLVELRKGFQGDGSRVDAELAVIRSDQTMTDAELEHFVGKLSGRIGFVREETGRPPKDIRASIRKLLENRDRAAAIRNRLLKDASAESVANKVSSLKVLAFPALQLILIEERADFESRRDDALKLLRLAPWQIDEQLKNAKPADGLFSDFLPNAVEIRRAQARLEQRVALLRLIESIRHHAATHDGQLPEKAESFALPLPTDPFTGKPFEYSVMDGIATVSGVGKQCEVVLKK